MRGRAAVEAFVASQLADEEAALRREDAYERLSRELNQELVCLLYERVRRESRYALELLRPSERP
jgi:hypothetical protein